MRPQALDALRGVEAILHAGDVGTPEVIAALEAVAPVTAVRGNVDRTPWARSLPLTALVEVGGVVLYLLHDLATLDLEPTAAEVAAVVYGHSHVPSVKERGGVLLINPGSAGPRRFNLPVTVGRIRVSGGAVRGEIIDLGLGRPV